MILNNHVKLFNYVIKIIQFLYKVFSAPGINPPRSIPSLVLAKLKEKLRSYRPRNHERALLIGWKDNSTVEGKISEKN